VFHRMMAATRAYGEDVAAFRAFTGKSLRATYLADLQRYADSVVSAPATRARRLPALKSLLLFAAKLGYLPFNVGATIRRRLAAAKPATVRSRKTSRSNCISRWQPSLHPIRRISRTVGTQRRSVTD
jgi:hypothetical protein